MPAYIEYQMLNTIGMVFSFLLGSTIGSFLNVCIYRIPRNESVIHPRSRCPKCGNNIAWYDNMPILSWVLLGAKCRNCGQPISWRYPLVEAITGLLFLAVFWRFGFTIASPVYMLVAAGLVLITFVDLDEWIIPNEVTYPGVPIGLACSLVGMFFPASMLRVQDPIVALLGIALGGGVLYLLDKLALLLLKKRGMGFGDVKLLAMLGAFVGWQGVLGIVMLASLLGSVIGVAMLVMNKRHPLPENNEEEDGDEAVPVQGNYLPFGPYLALAGFIFILFGPEMIDLYIGFLTPSAPIPAVLPM